MMADESFNNLLKIDIPKDIVIILGSYTENGIVEYRKLKVTKHLQEEIQSIILKLLAKKKNLLESNDLTIVEYDPGNRLDKYSQIEYIEFPQIDYLSKFIFDIPDFIHIPLFNPHDTNFITKLRFYIFCVKLNDDYIHFFLATRNMKQIIDGNKIIARLFDNIYDTSNDPIFIFDKSIDCITFDKYIFIMNKQKFHQIFSFYSELKNKAQKTLIDNNLDHIIGNYGEFVDTCMKIPFMYIKLASIGDKDYIKNVKMDDLITAIEVYKLNIEILGENGKRKLVFDPKHKWEILRLLDDGYLKSDMTTHRYAVNSKIPINSK